MQSIFHRLNSFFARTAISTSAAQPEEREIDAAIFNDYSFIIGGVFSYFNDLTVAAKWKFVKRTHQFRQQKRFHFIGLENNENTAILVSSSAVQVTFGLKNYQLSYFKDIYILADAYHMDNDDELYIGHVAPDGIYLSWKHFLYGYSYKSDNINVAVHEMAHALLYNNFFAQYGIDPHFRLNYEKFSTSTGPILADVIAKRRSYLRSYAFSNMHEFWAVSVEAFFENPEGLRRNMPDLYEALSNVLNQDPITKTKLLKPES
ncbi:MAG: zinc-dependent peptidase [Chitinophagaceae bacterium]